MADPLHIHQAAHFAVGQHAEQGDEEGQGQAADPAERDQQGIPRPIYLR